MDFYELRDHQIRALKKLSNGKILWGGVGTGKSRVAAAYYHINEAPKRVYVITTAKKRDSFDWQEEFYRIGIGPATGPVPIPSGKGKGRGGRTGSSSDSTGPTEPESRRSAVENKSHGRGSGEPSGLLLEGDRDGQTPAGERSGSAGSYPWVLTIDSWNNIAKYANVAGAFFIFDEQRLVGSGDWTRKFLRIAKHNNWILLSGTPGDTWMDYVPVFVANDFYKNRTAFKREHVVYNTFTKFPKVDRYINVGKLMRQRAQLLVEMPYERHTKRRLVEVPLRFDKEALEMVLKKRWNIYENRPLRDVAEMFSVGRKVVNSDRSRIEMVQELWQKHPKLIIFYNFNYELEILRGLGRDCLGTTDESSGKLQKEWLGSMNGLSSTTSGPQDYEVPFRGTIIRSAGISTTTSLQTATSTSLAERLDPRWRTTNQSPSPSGSGFESISTLNSQRGNARLGPFDTSTTSVSTTNHEVGLGSAKVHSLEQFTIAEWNGHKHQPIPSTSRWLYLVQYTAGAEGWNCIETDAMIMFSRNYSWKVCEQAYGRIDRLNTPFQELWYYDFTSESFIDLAIGRSLKAKETFNEAKYARLFKE